MNGTKVQPIPGAASATIRCEETDLLPFGSSLVMQFGAIRQFGDSVSIPLLSGGGEWVACHRFSPNFTGAEFQLSLRLPQFDLGAVGIRDPGEAAARIGVALENVHVPAFQHRDESI